ncbi:MAG: hypothetical protein OXQ89_03045 [Rhodospirillaceae bacterium]|nr:hypothetical protein [Rhodospirillaceae bacterium]
MSELTLQQVIDRIHKGSNPVEVAGFGRESTHKGYLTWLLDTSHWASASRALVRLVEAALPSWPDRHRASAHRWIQHCPDAVYTLFEQRVGNGKVDLLVKAGNGDNRALLPIELKTDSKVRKNQLTKMSTEGSPPIGLVLLLGSSAVRDRILPEIEGRGCFAPLRLHQVLDAWQDIHMPRPGIDWLESLKHEQTRLTRAFEKGTDGPWQAYRSNKHLYYARLASVKRELENQYGDFGSWRLYDGGFNTVLNLTSDGGWSWNRVAQGNAKALWEFNDQDFVLKIEQCGDESATRKWISDIQAKLVPGHLPNGLISRRPRAARAGSQWISAWRWRMPFDSATEVAGRSVAIMRETQPLIG